MNKRKVKINILLLLVMTVLFSSSMLCLAASKKPISLEILTTAKTVDYCVDDSLNTKGLRLLVSYDDGSKVTLTKGYQTSYNFSTVGKKDVVLSYAENGVTVKTNYSVNVIEKPILFAPSKEIYAGTTFEVPVVISKNCGLMGFDIKVTYDPEIFTPISVAKGTLITDGLMDDSITTAEKGSFDIIWSGSKEFNKDGTICTVKFVCNSNTSVTSSIVQLSNVRDNTYRENYNTILCKENKATLKINNSKSGNSKKVLTDLTLIMPGWEKGNTPSKPLLSGNKGNGSVIYSYAKLDDANYSNTIPNQVGTYIVKATVAETDEYYGGIATCVFTISNNSISHKLSQEISGVKAEYIKSVNSKAYKLKAITNGDGKLSYKSSNKNVVTVSKNGKVTIKGIGSAKITITATETSKYEDASKKITITVRPIKSKIVKVTSSTPNTASVKWNSDKAVNGYEILVATNKKFTKSKCYKIKTNTKTTKKITKLKSGKHYYIKMRSYKKVGKKTIFSAYSSTKKLIVK